MVSDEEMGDVAGHPLGWHLAEALSRDFDVILATPVYSAASHRSFAVVYYNRRNLGLLADASDFVVLVPETADRYAFFSEAGSLRSFDSESAQSGLPGLAAAVARSHPAPEILIWTPPPPPGGPAHYLRRLRYHLKTGGPGQVWDRLRARLSGRRPGN